MRTDSWADCAEIGRRISAQCVSCTDILLFIKHFLMETDAGVRQIHKAIVQRKPHHAFPVPLATAVRVLRILPAGLYTKMVSSTKHTNEKGKKYS